METEHLPRLSHYAIVTGPSLEQLLDQLKNGEDVLIFRLEQHGANSPQTETLICDIVSLSVPDRDGMRRIELFRELNGEYNLYFAGQYNPVTKLGTGTLEKRAKPCPAAPPVPPLTGAEVAALLQQQAP